MLSRWCVYAPSVAKWRVASLTSTEFWDREPSPDDVPYWAIQREC